MESAHCFLHYHHLYDQILNSRFELSYVKEQGFKIIQRAAYLKALSILKTKAVEFKGIPFQIEILRKDAAFCKDMPALQISMEVWHSAI